tara:strand:- start:5986 stop:7221 length:1236 start_codon:yes stop_codon:yes gene_type:complete
MEIDFTQKIIEAKEKKTLNKPFRTPGGPKKFSVYVKNEKGNVVKVNFGDPNMEIKRDDPKRRKSFRARHNCDNPGPKWKARYWSCKQWRAGKKVEGSEDSHYEWDGETLFDHDELLELNPALAFVEEEVTEGEEEKDCCGQDCGCHEEKSEAELTDKQKKLPEFIQKNILKKKGKDSSKKSDDKKDSENKKDDKEDKDSEASLWENIHKKRERIKRGSGEKMRKKGEKGAPTSDQLDKAKKKSKAEEEQEIQPYIRQKKTVDANYEMTDEEYIEVMTSEDLALCKEESEAAKKRPGRKSGAQTPAKPSERKKGSDKNKKGSAGKGGGKITFSEKVINSLKKKVKDHNSKSKKKVTLSQLKKVYRRGAGAFSQSHRPGMSRGGWAMARVNMFLKMKRGGKVKKSYRDADGDI